MKLRFEEEKGVDGMFLVYEDGKDTEKIKYEFVGILCLVGKEKEHFLNIDENYSGLIAVSEMKQIMDFAEQNKEESK